MSIQLLPFSFSHLYMYNVYVHVYIYKKAAIGYKSNEKREQYAFKCGGSIISEQFILTGAYGAKILFYPFNLKLLLR